MQIKNPRRLIPFGLYFLSIFFLYVSTNILNTYEPFYEDKIYVYYTDSMIEDGDFNIINQVPEKMRWMVTDQYFHPDTHSKIQTPFLHALASVESVLQKIFGQYEARYFLPSFFLHLILLWMGFYFCSEIALRLSIKLSVEQVVLFSLSSSLLYFSLFKYNVIEVFCFPFMSYILLNSLKLKKAEEKNNELMHFAMGVSMAVLIAVKPTYLLLCILGGAAIGLHCYRKWRIKPIVLASSGFGLIYISVLVNRFIQFGANLDYAFYSRHLFDFSFSNIYLSLTKGFFGVGGVFHTNPSFLFGSIGFILLLVSSWRKRLLSSFECMILIGWMTFGLFQTVPIIGYITDDHLVGRLNLTALPLLILGFSYFYLALTKRHKLFSIVFYIAVAWHLFYLMNYMAIDLNGHYLYQRYKVLPSHLWNETLNNYTNLIKWNLNEITNGFFVIVIFSLILASIFSSFRNFSSIKKLFASLTVYLTVSFMVMTVVNYFKSPQNIKKYAANGIYDEKVIVKPGEILVYDYILDRLSAIAEGDDEEAKRKLRPIVEEYFNIISKQVLSSNEEFDKILRDRDIRSTIFHKDD